MGPVSRPKHSAPRTMRPAIDTACWANTSRFRVHCIRANAARARGSGYSLASPCPVYFGKTTYRTGHGSATVPGPTSDGLM